VWFVSIVAFIIDVRTKWALVVGMSVGMSYLPEDLSSIVYWLAHAEGEHRAGFFKILDQVVRANGLYEPPSSRRVQPDVALNRTSTIKQFTWSETSTLKWWTNTLVGGAYNPLREPKPFVPLVEQTATGPEYVTRSSSLKKALSSNGVVGPLLTAWGGVSSTEGSNAQEASEDRTSNRSSSHQSVDMPDGEAGDDRVENSRDIEHPSEEQL